MPIWLLLLTGYLVYKVKQVRQEDLLTELKDSEGNRPPKVSFFSDPLGEMHDPDMAKLYDAVYGDLSLEDLEDKLRMELLSQSNLHILPTGVRELSPEVTEVLDEITQTTAERVIYCNGYALQPCSPSDLNFFRGHIVQKAYQDQVYNGIPLDDGGVDKLYIDWFRMKGASEDAAESLYFQHSVFPWEWEGFQL